MISIAAAAINILFVFIAELLHEILRSPAAANRHNVLT
jgi:hypothetical protein